MTKTTDDVDEIITRLSGIRQVVINAGYGGFGLSERAIERYAELSGQCLIPVESEHGYSTIWYKDSVDEKNLWCPLDIARDDKYLVQVVKELGHEADDYFASLKVVEIPADVDWMIDEYDGNEWIAEVHRRWS